MNEQEILVSMKDVQRFKIITEVIEKKLTGKEYACPKQALKLPDIQVFSQTRTRGYTNPAGFRRT